MKSAERFNVDVNVGEAVGQTATYAHVRHVNAQRDYSFKPKRSNGADGQLRSTLDQQALESIEPNRTKHLASEDAFIGLLVSGPVGPVDD